MLGNFFTVALLELLLKWVTIRTLFEFLLWLCQRWNTFQIPVLHLSRERHTSYTSQLPSYFTSSVWHSSKCFVCLRRNSRTFQPPHLLTFELGTHFKFRFYFRQIWHIFLPTNFLVQLSLGKNALIANSIVSGIMSPFIFFEWMYFGTYRRTYEMNISESWLSCTCFPLWWWWWWGCHEKYIFLFSHFGNRFSY